MSHSRRDSKKEALWRERMAAFAASGESVSRWCMAQGLSEAVFYYWRRTLRERDGFIEITPSVVTPEVRLTWHDGMALHLPASISPVVLTELVHRLRSAAC